MNSLFDKALNNVSPEVKNFVDLSFNIVNQIHNVLEKQGKTQKDLADLLGKKESEISKWMRGTHNFTTKSLSKIETVLGEKIICTPDYAKESFKTEFLKQLENIFRKTIITENQAIIPQKINLCQTSTTDLSSISEKQSFENYDYQFAMAS